MMQPILAPPLVSHTPDAAEIRRQLADGQYLIASSQQKAAVLLLWPAFEAAVCLSLTELGQETDDPIALSADPLGLVTQAVAYGVIDPEDRDVLHRLLPVYGAAVNGDAESIDTELLQDVARFTERTLNEINQ